MVLLKDHDMICLFKYFLELTPEEEVIHPSLLTKFRKQRLKDENILDLLINKSVELAINQGVFKKQYYNC